MNTNVFKPVQIFDFEEKAVTRIFGITRSPYWGVVDRYDVETNGVKSCYIMLHFDSDKLAELHKREDIPTEEKQSILSLRGVILDVSEKDNEKIICSSIGYTPDVILPSGCETISSLVDTHNNSQDSFLNNDAVTIYPAYEGTLIRAWKYNGQVFFSTNKKINPVNSNWGKSEKFLALYQKFGGPEAEMLFDTNQNSSSVVYYFMICDKSLLFSSKMDIGDGFLVFLGKTSQQEVMFWNQDKLVNVESDEEDLGYPTGDKTNRCIYSPPSLTMEKANLVINYGPCYYAKDRIDTNKHSFLRTGEPVMMVKKDSEGNLLSTCRVIPDAYYQKCKILDQNPNTLNRVFIINDITNQGGEKYSELFPVVGAPTKEEFKECKSILTATNLFTYPTAFNKVTEVQLLGNTDEAKDLRFRNALMCVILSVPAHLQQDVCDYYQSLEDRKTKILNYLTNNYNHLENIFVLNKMKVKDSEILNKIMWFKDNKNTSACLAVERLITNSSRGTPEQRRTHKNKLPANIKLHNLEKLVDKEFGLRSYQLSQAIINSEKIH